MSTRLMGKTWKRYLKVASFLAVVVALALFSKLTVEYTYVPAGTVPLSDAARAKVSLDSVNGAVQTIFVDTSGGENEPQRTSFQGFNASGGILVQPKASNVQGCSTDFDNIFDITVSFSNDLVSPATGSLNVTVYDDTNGQLLKSKVVSLSFEPRKPTSVTVEFTVMSHQYDPTYLVKVSLPTAQELNSLPKETKQVPVFEYVLLRLGILSVDRV